MDKGLVIGVSVGMEYVESALFMSTSFTTAVCIDDDGQVISCHKTHTSDTDVFIGVKKVLELVLKDIKPENIVRVTIGTPQVLDAVLSHYGLSKVMVLRLCGPSTQSLPPFVNFPEGPIKKKIMGGIRLLNGGYEFNGVPTANVEITKIDVEEVLQTIDDIKEGAKKQGPNHVVICGVYSPDKTDQELQVASIFQQYCPDVDVTLSYQVVRKNGLLQRENASILNASLKIQFEDILKNFDKVLRDVNVHAPVYLVDNNAKLVSGMIKKDPYFPINTFFSLEATMMKAAHYLTGLDHAIVINIGGTESIAAILTDGKPRVQISTVDVAGISTYSNSVFTVPLKLGLFSIVHYSNKSTFKGIGPDHVDIYTDALVFGGETLTMIDIAVANDMIDMGDPKKVEKVDKGLIKQALGSMHTKIETLIDMSKESSADLPAVLLGLGSALIDVKSPLKGTSKVLRPENYEVAEAIGAAVIDPTHAQLSPPPDDTTDNDTTLGQSSSSGRSKGRPFLFTNRANTVPHEMRNHAIEEAINSKTAGTNVVNRALAPNAHVTDEPHIDPKTGEWLLTVTDLEYLSIGVGILGSGGGGDPTIAKLLGTQQIKKGKTIRVIAPERLANMKGLAGAIAYMGDPKVVIEKLPNGLEGVRSLKCMTDLYDCAQYNQGKIEWNWKPAGSVTAETLERACKYIQDFPTVYNPQEVVGVNMVALMPLEIGGMNGFQPLVVSSMTDLPVLDCDGMGRSIPELQMYGPSMYGDLIYPSTMSGYKGERIVALRADTPHDLELFFRNETVEMGSVSVITLGPLDATSVKDHTVKYTISQSYHIGKAVIDARHNRQDPIQSILDLENGTLLIRNGKVTDIKYKKAGGFDQGQYTVVDENNQTLTIDYKNENLVAREGGPDGKVRASCPDLISLVDESGNPITTTALQYGLRLSVLALPCSPLLTTPRALAKCGPRALGYDFDYIRIGKYVQPIPIPPLP